jgi:hypothetical protein
VPRVLIYDHKASGMSRDQIRTSPVEGRDVWWQDVIPEQSTECEVVWVGAEDPLFKVGTGLGQAGVGARGSAHGGLLGGGCCLRQPRCGGQQEGQEDERNAVQRPCVEAWRPGWCSATAMAGCIKPA